MSPSPHPRIGSGNALADEILCGGFPANSINIVMGLPGTGKSLFAEQLVFANAGDDRPIVYLTTMSEPLAKVLTYLQRFAFYDEKKLGTAVIYDEVGPLLAKDGIGALLPALEETIRTNSPKIIVIDSFKVLHDLSPSVSEMRRTLFELSGILTAYQTTVFLIGEYSDEDAQRLPEFAVADGIVQMLRNPLSTRDERFIRVLKLRGSRYLEGLHGFKITSGGLEIYPRLVSPDVPEGFEFRDRRLTTGVPGLDDLLGGGVWCGSMTLLSGPTGAGKSTIGLQFALEGLRHEQRSLYVNFQENPTVVARALHNLGFAVEDARAQGLYLMYASPVELQIDSLIVTMFRMIAAEGIQRVVIDALGDLVMASSDPQRLHNYLYALTQQFAVLGVTSILTFESDAGSSEAATSAPGGRFSYMADNIVMLQTQVRDEQMTRSVTVLKARGTQHDLRVRPLEITASGVRVG
ncbi:MAG: ATPase domain-containing protein [Pseudomonadota bacterium]|nr:ATPase domain-containing protein [Pseudomonadota bacterium]